MNQVQWSFLWKRTCGVMTVKKGCNSLSIAEFNTLYYVSFQPFFFLSYCLLEFDEFFYLFQGDI